MTPEEALAFTVASSRGMGRSATGGRAYGRSVSPSQATRWPGTTSSAFVAQEPSDQLGALDGAVHQQKMTGVGCDVNGRVRYAGAEDPGVDGRDDRVICAGDDERGRGHAVQP